MNWEEVHSKVRELGEERFNNGFYADAVLSTFREIKSIVKSEIQTITGTEYDGVKLMRQAFSFQYVNGLINRNAIILFVPDLSTKSRRIFKMDI